MTEHGPRTGAARDVPPPRPIPSPPPEVEETGLGRAARAVAEAVAGLVGGAPGQGADPGTAGGDAGPKPAGTGLRDVVGAVAGAVASAFGQARAPGGSTGSTEGTSGSERSAGAVLGDVLAAAAPRLPIRDADRLRAEHPGATDEDIADALVTRAARITSGIGAAIGGLSAAHWLTPPSLIALPLELGAETVLIGGVELVLIGELHELYDRRPAGDPRARASAYLSSWSTQRAVADAGAAGLGSILGAAGIGALRRRLTRRLAGAVPTAAPFLIGAALGGRGNRRATETLAGRVLDDLRAPRPVRPPS